MEKLSKTIYRYRYLLYILALIPMFLARDFTRNNELRYLSIADEAIRNGNIFTFTNHGVHYADKPPLYLWIVMAGKLIFGTHSMLFLALFSYIPALVVMWIMNRWSRSVTSPMERVAGELMLLTSVFFLGSAVVLRMDMLMCMFITLSLYTFYKIYTGKERRWDRWLFPVYIFLAIFSKGPVGIMVPLMTTIVFLLVKREWRLIGKFWGLRTIGTLLLLCALWFGAAWTEGGNEYMNNLLFNQTINRAVDSFHHKEPFWYYMVAIWYSLAPWVFIILSVLFTGVFKRIIRTDMERIFLIASLGTFVMMSLVSSKIQIYLLPSFPFFVWITVLWMGRFSRGAVVKTALIIPSAILLLSLPGVVAAGLMNLFPVFESIWIPAAATVLSVAGFIALRQVGSAPNRTIISIGTGVLLAVFTISFYIPRYNPHLGMGAVTSVASAMAKESGVEVFYVYDIPRAENADVYLGKSPEGISLDGLRKIVESGGDGILIVKQSSLEEVPELAALLEGRERRVSGYFFCITL